MTQKQQQNKSTLEFRKEALDSLTASDRTDQLIQVTTAKSWIILATLGSLVLATVIWGFWGTVTIWVEGEGMLLPEQGSIYNAVAPAGPGHIVQINVGPNERVQKGQVLAELKTPNLSKQVGVTRNYVQGLKKKYAEEKITADKEIAERRDTLKKQNQMTQQILATEKENLKSSEKLLEMRKEFLKKKMTTNQQYQSTLMRYYESKNQIEQTKSQLLQNELDAESFIDRWTERLKSLDAKLRDEQLELDTLEEKLKLSQHVKSPISGVVIGVRKTVGDVVREGDPLINIATTGEGIDAVIYMAPQDGKRVKADMNALVVPTTVKKEEYGGIKGNVTYVSSFPVTPQGMQAVLQNEELVENFTKNGPLIAVRVRLTKDGNTFSGLKWSSSKGPEQKITPGTLMSGRITVRAQSPFSLVIPSLKKVLEP